MSGSSPVAQAQDLLRQRRLERGLPADPPPMPQARGLLLVGGAIGSGALALVLAITAVLAWQQGQVSAAVAAMQAVPVQLQALEDQLRAEKGKLDKLSQSNDAIARGLVAVSSGSALLTQLAALTPQGVQISELSVQGQNLALKGRADDPDAFARVNALSLLLAGSPLFGTGQVRIIKLSRETAAAAPTPAGTAPRTPPVAWELTADLARLPPAEQLPLLQALAADGMAARLRDLLGLGVLR
jgi:type IV pilus assembly protein PilN